MNVSFYIAKRYLRSKSSNNAINFITNIAALGVVLGAAALFIVLSGFAGLKDFTLQFSTIVDPDLKAVTATGKSFFLTDDEANKLNTIDAIASYSKIIEERAVIAFDDKNYLATLKGVDENYQKVTNIDSVIVQGEWFTPNTNQIVVGWGVSRNLSFGVLDYGKSVNIYVPKPGKGQITSINSAYSTVRALNVGIFDINETLNDSYVYLPMELAAQLLNYEPNQVSDIEFKLKDGVNMEDTMAEIQSVLGDKVILKTKLQLNDAIYKMLNGENLFVYLLLTLVSALLIFNVIGSLIMMMLEKKQSLNTLFSLGVTVNKIRNIFFFHGSVMTLVGCTLGLILGFAVVFIQKTFGLVPITETLPYPVSVNLENIILVYITISVLGVFSSKIASRKITEAFIKNF